MYVANKAIIVNNQGQILILRDSGQGDHANNQGVWDVPGGRMEKGETPLEGLARELSEEVGIEIDPEKTRPVHVDKWGVSGDVANQPIIGIFHLVKLEAQDIQLSDEHTEAHWLGSSSDFNVEINDSTLRAIAAYKRYATSS